MLEAPARNLQGLLRGSDVERLETRSMLSAIGLPLVLPTAPPSVGVNEIFHAAPHAIDPAAWHNAAASLAADAAATPSAGPTAAPDWHAAEPYVTPPDQPFATDPSATATLAGVRYSGDVRMEQGAIAHDAPAMMFSNRLDAGNWAAGPSSAASDPPALDPTRDFAIDHHSSRMGLATDTAADPSFGLGDATNNPPQVDAAPPAFSTTGDAPAMTLSDHAAADPALLLTDAAIDLAQLEIEVLDAVAARGPAAGSPADNPAAADPSSGPSYATAETAAGDPSNTAAFDPSAIRHPTTRRYFMAAWTILASRWANRWAT